MISQVQAYQKAQASSSMQSGTSSPDQGSGTMQSSGMQSPALSPSASPGQHPFAMSNPAALAFAAQQMGLAGMNMPMGMNGMNMNPMLQMQMNLASMNGMGGMGNLGGPFANPHAMQSVMRNPSPSPMPIGGQNFMGMGGMPGY